MYHLTPESEFVGRIVNIDYEQKEIFFDISHNCYAKSKTVKFTAIASIELIS
jgi:hypothetical protein